MDKKSGLPQTLAHKMSIQNRSEATFTGIIDVLSFDETDVILDSSYGSIHVKGKNMVIQKLNLESGEVDISGEYDSIVYGKAKSRKDSGESVISRMFR